MIKIDENYITQCLKDEDKDINICYNLLIENGLEENEAIEILNSVYYAYCGYCEEQNFEFKDEEFQKELLNSINSLLIRQENITNMLSDPTKGKNIYFEVKLRGYEECFYRIIKIASFFRLSDLVYFILATFKAFKGEMYVIDYLSTLIYPAKFLDEKDKENKILAEYIFLAEMELEKNTTFTLEYGFEEDWIFDIKVLENDGIIKKQEDANPYIIEAKGIGIIEGNKDKFVEVMKEYYLNKENNDLEEIITFDLDQTNEIINSLINNLQNIYEKGE